MLQRAGDGSAGVRGDVEFVLSSLRTSDNVDALRSAVDDAVQVLSDRGIGTREQLVDVLADASWYDFYTRLWHGLASGLPFAASSAWVDAHLGSAVADAIARVHPEWADWRVQLVAGIGLSAFQSVGNVAAGGSREASFADAYLTRPPVGLLPEELRGINTDEAWSASKAAAWDVVYSYGIESDVGVRLLPALVLEGLGRHQQRVLVDKITDASGALIAGGLRGLVYSHRRDVTDGRAGLQFFLARSDLGEQIDFLRGSRWEKFSSGLNRAGLYVSNHIPSRREVQAPAPRWVPRPLRPALQAVRPYVPLGVERAFFTTPGWVSHTSLGLGVAPVSYVNPTITPPLLTPYVGERAANTISLVAKYIGLAVVFWGWGAAVTYTSLRSLASLTPFRTFFSSGPSRLEAGLDQPPATLIPLAPASTTPAPHQHRLRITMV